MSERFCIIRRYPLEFNGLRTEGFWLQRSGTSGAEGCEFDPRRAHQTKRFRLPARTDVSFPLSPNDLAICFRETDILLPTWGFRVSGRFTGRFDTHRGGECRPI
jgi:hypothetical protein